MGRFVDFLKRLNRDLGIDLGGVEVGVTEHGLDEADVGTVLQHVGGHGVAEEMAGTLYVESGLLDVAFDPGSQGVASKGVAMVVEEEGSVIMSGDQAGPDLVAVFFDPGECPFADGDEAIFAALPFAYHDDLTSGINVVEGEVDQLHAADAGTVERFHDGAIS